MHENLMRYGVRFMEFSNIEHKEILLEILKSYKL